MKYFGSVLVFLLCLACTVLVETKTAQEWKSRVIYQIITDRFARSDGNTDNCSDLRNYCGGTFKGIVNNLDYIEGLGVNAIWISPVVEQTDGGYHGYWAKDLTKINSHFGTADDLKNLVAECNKRDIWVMVDVVANHMGYPPGCPGCSASANVNFTGFNPFNKAEYFHNYCIINDWSNQGEVENCRLADLPDLNQENPYVRTTLKTWVHDLVDTYKFDGIRIDTIPEVPKDFWSEFGKSAGVFQIGEVDNGDPSYVGPYQGPLTAVLNYPFFFTFRDVFGNKKSMRGITDRYGQESQHFQDLSILGGFVDNHDNPRFLSGNDDWTALKNALAFNIMAQWIPIIYYGTEQAFKGGNDPNNRETLWPHYDNKHLMYQFIRTVTSFRKSLGTGFFESKQQERWVDDDFYLFTRGPDEKVVVALTRNGSGSQLQRTIPNLPHNDGTKLTNIFDPSDQITCTQGKITVSITNGQPKIYFAGTVPPLPELPTRPPTTSQRPSTTSSLFPTKTSTQSQKSKTVKKSHKIEPDAGTLAVIVIVSISLSAVLTAILILVILKKTGFRFRYEVIR